MPGPHLIIARLYEHLEPIDPWHFDIEEYQIRSVFLNTFNSFGGCIANINHFNDITKTFEHKFE